MIANINTKDDILCSLQSQVEGINQQLAPLFSNETLTADVFEIEVAPLPRGYSTIALYHGNTIYINVNDLDLLTPIEVAVTTLHEGNPGI